VIALALPFVAMLGVAAVCRAIGLSRATWYRLHAPVDVGADGELELTWSRDEAALTESARRDGRWPLVTNRANLGDAELCAWAVRRYKTHGRVERDQHLLKGPLRLRPFFVHNDDHVRALVAVCVGP